MKMKMVLPHTPEGAEALSPGQRPGLLRTIAFRPVRAKALKLQAIYTAVALTGRLAEKPLYPGRCPGYNGFSAFSPYLKT